LNQISHDGEREVDLPNTMLSQTISNNQ